MSQRISRKRLLALCVVFLAGVARSQPARPANAVTDSLYRSHHPRLLFTNSELSALSAKVIDGGYDDTAYAYLRSLAENSYPFWTPLALMRGEYGLTTIPNLGLAGWLESPVMLRLQMRAP